MLMCKLIRDKRLFSYLDTFFALVDITVDFPHDALKRSGFAFGCMHLLGSDTRPSSVSPLVHSGDWSMYESSMRPHAEHVGNPSGEITFTP
jgi:hypothetical protein